MRLDFRLPPRADLVWRDIHWPHELAPDLAVALLRQVATDAAIRLIVFEVEARHDMVSHRVGAPQAAVDRISHLLPALIAGTALTPANRKCDFQDAWRVGIATKQRPLQTTEPDRTARALLAALTAVRPGERVVVQWVLGRGFAPRPVAASELAPRTGSWLAPLVSGSSQLEPGQKLALELKRGDHAFACVGRLAINGSVGGRPRALAVGVLAALRVAEAPGVGVRLIREPADKVERAAVPWRWPLLLNVQELVGLLSWPLGDQPLPGFPRDRSRWLRADPHVRQHGRVLGATTAPGDDRLLGLSIEDARQHMHVIGPTGTGKSTLLARLALADIQASRSVVVIDPKGDLVADLLPRIPAHRVDDVVVIDPAERSAPVGLNPLLLRGRRPELIADQVLAVFHGLWASNWGPRLQDILHSSLLTLAGRDDASLCVLPALLTNPAVRQRLRAGIDDPIALEPFWAWFESISDAERQQAISPVLNKLRPFLLRRSVRAIVGQIEPRFRVDEIFTTRRIVLVSLAKGLIGPEAAALLGSLFVAELWQAVLGRAAVPERRRSPVVVYADEFQDYVHLPTDMADALAQARGLGVGLVLAHQHWAQLPANIKAAVEANARSRVCFQLAASDAQAMARSSGGLLEARDFQRLPRYEAYAQLVAGGEVTNFASLHTVPLPPTTSDPEAVRAASRGRYGRPIDEVEAELRQIIDGGPTDARVGRRRVPS